MDYKKAVGTWFLIVPSINYIEIHSINSIYIIILYILNNGNLGIHIFIDKIYWFSLGLNFGNN